MDIIRLFLRSHPTFPFSLQPKYPPQESQKPESRLGCYPGGVSCNLAYLHEETLKVFSQTGIFSGKTRWSVCHIGFPGKPLGSSMGFPCTAAILAGVYLLRRGLPGNCLWPCETDPTQAAESIVIE